MRNTSTKKSQVVKTSHQWWTEAQKEWGHYSVTSDNYTLSRGQSDIVVSDGHIPTTYSAYTYRAHAKSAYLKGTAWNGYWSGQGGWQNVHTIWQGKSGLSLSNLRYIGTHTPAHSSLHNQVMARIYDKILDQKADFGETAAEIRSNGRMMWSSLRSLALALVAFKRKDYKNVAKHLGVKNTVSATAANSWLAWKFGWLPLMQVAYNGGDAIKQAFNKPEGYINFTHQMSDKYTPPSTYSYTRKGSLDVGVKVGLRYSIEDKYRHGINSLGLMNPALIAWNAVPYSFIVDWIFSVSTVLQAASIPIGLQFKDSYASYWTKGKYDLFETPTFPTENGGQFGWSIDQNVFRRTAQFSFPMLRLTFNFGLSQSKALTSLALILQRA